MGFDSPPPEKTPGSILPAAPSKAARFPDPERLAIAGDPSSARVRDALPRKPAISAHPCDPRAQPEIT
jgi:hypothetical protein